MDTRDDLLSHVFMLFGITNVDLQVLKNMLFPQSISPIHLTLKKEEEICIAKIFCY